ncbi:MAG: prepilin-type N-terminal cleavage/methylation domain-containing protein [Betaproteobacteria bacterium]|nr:prepilin-type N-terminal cleavage/methylation domain-containing protein [Betaproteobacteria bacterium]
MYKPAVLQRLRRRTSQQRGTTMIEVLVAVLVLSVGLLGLAAMQTKALKTASGLATQQVIVQSLGAFSEARLAAPNQNIVGESGPNNENAQYLARYCNPLWSGLSINSQGESQIQQPTTQDLNFITTFLTKYTSCGSAALTEYADYWNQYNAGVNIFGNNSSWNGTECDYIVPRTRRVSCTLPTGDAISLQNLVWVR